MKACPYCRIVLTNAEVVCPRDGEEGREFEPIVVPEALERRFVIVAPFAHGNAGTSYLADEPETGRRGLLKVLGPAPRGQQAERQRMRRELMKLSTLCSPGIAVPWATGEADQSLWVFREWIAGDSLAVELRRRGALPIDLAQSIAAQLTAALDHLHRAGLLHRDLKPGHVLLNTQPDGVVHVHVIDSVMCTPLEANGITATFGTVGYAAPEQLQGKLASFRSDLYALGCLMYEMLVGVAPFARMTLPETREAQLTSGAPEPPADLPPVVSSLIRSLLARDPHERPFSAQKLRRTLDPYLPESVLAAGSSADLRASASGSLPPPRPAAGARIGSRVPALSLGRASIPQKAPAPRRKTSIPPPLPSAATSEFRARASTAVSPGVLAPINVPEGRVQRPDMTEPIEPQHILMVEKFVAPPARTDKTEPLELSHILAEVKRTSRPPPPPTASKSERPPAARHSERPAPPSQRPAPAPDLTQPLRLEQILAVASARSKASSKPPPPRPGVIAAQTKAHEVNDVELDIDSLSPPGLSTALGETAPSELATAASSKPPRNSEEEVHFIHSDPPIAMREQPAVLPLLTNSEPAPLTGAAESPAATQVPEAVLAIAPEPTERTAPTERAASNVGLAPTVAADAPVALEAPVALQHDLPEPSATSEEPLPHSIPVLSSPSLAPESRDAAPRQGARFTRLALAAVALLGVVAVGALAFRDDASTPPSATALQGTTSTTLATAKAPDPTAKSTEPLSPPPKPATEPTVAAAAPQPAALAVPAVPPPPAKPNEDEGTDDAPPTAEKVQAELPKAAAAPRRQASSDRSSERETRRHTRNAQSESHESNETKWAKARDEARSFYAAHRYREAADAYERAVRYDSSHAGTWAGLGAARLNANDPKGAAQAYQRAIKIAPKTSGFHAALGRALLASGETSKAKAAYNKALALDPDNEAARSALKSL